MLIPQNQSVSAGIGQGWGVFRTYDSVTYGRISASSAEWAQCVTKCILSEHRYTMEGFRPSSELSTPKGGGVHLGISGLLSQRTQPMKSGKLVRRKTWRSKSEHVLFSFSAFGGARRQRVVPPGTVGNTSDVWVASPWFSGPKPSEFPYNPKSSWFFGY